jgi:hypothetical protein
LKAFGWVLCFFLHPCWCLNQDHGVLQHIVMTNKKVCGYKAALNPKLEFKEHHTVLIVNEWWSWGWWRVASNVADASDWRATTKDVGTAHFQIPYNNLCTCENFQLHTVHEPIPPLWVCKFSTDNLWFVDSLQTEKHMQNTCCCVHTTAWWYAMPQ